MMIKHEHITAIISEKTKFYQKEKMLNAAHLLCAKSITTGKNKSTNEKSNWNWHTMGSGVAKSSTSLNWLG